MVELTPEEKQRRQELIDRCNKEVEERKAKAKDALTKEQQQTCEDIRCIGIYGVTSYPAVYHKLRKGLQDGTYEKPSQFFEKELSWLVDGLIPAQFKPHFIYAVDNVLKYPYSTGYARRSFRAGKYHSCCKRIFEVVSSFTNLYIFDADVADILSYNLPEKEKYYLQKYQGYAINCDIVAYELDHGNTRVEKVIEDIIMGESEGHISTRLFLSIVKSSNAKMHELLCKLLLAARLQEGLRQSICECADSGTIEAFRAILKVIEDNDLIRFSAVKRAVGVWTGLLAYESNDLDRISGKTLRLMIECLDSVDKREEYLKTEDSMQIYMALWAYATEDVLVAMQKVEQLATDGTHHQVLTAGYFNANLDNFVFAELLGKKLIKLRPTEQDIMAVYLPYFMPNTYNYTNAVKSGKGTENYEYFKSREEAEEYYEIFLSILNSIPKKEVVFSPCVFPWYSAALTRSAVATRLCVTAHWLGDNDKIDFACTLIKDIGTNRRGILEMLLNKPKTPTQYKLLTASLCDRESYTRDAAFVIASRLDFAQEYYLQMEDMLKYKSADMRDNLIELLMKQDDEALCGSVQRLLSDKKEEKRTAGLDMVIRIAEKRGNIADRCREYARAMEEPSTKEKILLENILGTADAADEEALYTDEDEFKATYPEGEFCERCTAKFMEYFPDSKLGEKLYPKKYKGSVKDMLFGKNVTSKQTMQDFESLHALIEAHKNDEFPSYGGEVGTVGGDIIHFREYKGNYDWEVPLLSLWRQWYEENINSPERLFRLAVLLRSSGLKTEYTEKTAHFVKELFGSGYDKRPVHTFTNHAAKIVEKLVVDKVPFEDLRLISAATALWYVNQDTIIAVPERNRYNNNIVRSGSALYHLSQINTLLYGFGCKNDADFEGMFGICTALADKALKDEIEIALRDLKAGVNRGYIYNARVVTVNGETVKIGNVPYQLGAHNYVVAAFKGMISVRTLYHTLFDENMLSEALSFLSNIVSAVREKDRDVSSRGHSYAWQDSRKKANVTALVGKSEDFTEEDERLLAFAIEIYESMINEVLSKELRRGDSETKYSGQIHSINRIYGLENFVAILSALGKETLERSTYYYSYASSSVTKKTSLSKLLSVCIPNPDDTAEKLAAMIKGTDITDKRLIEAAMYSPEWLDIVGEYLGWEGFRSACYYFMAHMNESFDNRRKAMIAKFTPLTSEQLNAGAFDIEWFRSAYEQMGEKRFNMIYDAAKYISDGSKHSRARKFADAALGKYDVAETEKTIADKRNKDLLMAYAVIPLEDDKALSRRYLFIQEFKKQSKKFGAQRSASEKAASETAMSNLATNAGFSDETRLTMRMEAQLVEQNKELFEPHEVDGVTLYLSVTDGGKAELICEKGGKALKSVPAKLKKDEYVLRLNAVKKQLTEQFRRTKAMLELAMEDGTEFAPDELRLLLQNPVVSPIVSALVFEQDEKTGFFTGEGLAQLDGALHVSDSGVKVAHPYALYKEGSWSEYQKKLFGEKTVQPFKQVFRELYVKTEEESLMLHSLRYSGNQIQPAKTVACLKTRRWVADVEDGLQKVYYKDNIVARIYAMADWFSPADIEAPTLEWVEFTDRKTGRPLEIGKVPDVIFSEVMRDVDLAVSVAHAGGVDPEATHSTMEMRKALLELTLPLFKLTNVRLEGNHAFIDGTRANYSVQLGSGVIHRVGGTMINVLPVHSQHRGKLFLPFADDDPKTAEIITKVLMFAEDKKIKDPFILNQI